MYVSFRNSSVGSTNSVSLFSIFQEYYSKPRKNSSLYLKSHEELELDYYIFYIFFYKTLFENLIHHCMLWR